ncbi:hypothetical protein L6452_14794 [Arctium lappa]|uniref:Uncharacterized protein n=1 Tax=Arctium lappa TaxID=4217 RepID=A0ACB9CLW3_ARCLA|nr:hypothetical protein L6452_14794 [Arctium lappa]
MPLQDSSDEASIDIEFTNPEGRSSEEDLIESDEELESTDLNNTQTTIGEDEELGESDEVPDSNELNEKDSLRMARGKVPLTKSLVAKFKSTQKDTSPSEREIEMNSEDNVVSLRDDENISLMPSSQPIASKRNLRPRVLTATHVEESGEDDEEDEEELEEEVDADEDEEEKEGTGKESNDDFPVLRLELEMLKPSFEIDGNALNCWAYVLNNEEKFKNPATSSRLFLDVNVMTPTMEDNSISLGERQMEFDANVIAACRGNAALTSIKVDLWHATTSPIVMNRPLPSLATTMSGSAFASQHGCCEGSKRVENK